MQSNFRNMLILQETMRVLRLECAKSRGHVGLVGQTRGSFSFRKECFLNLKKETEIDGSYWWLPVLLLDSSSVLIKIGFSTVVSFTGNWYGYYQWNPKKFDFQTNLYTKSLNIVSSK